MTLIFIKQRDKATNSLSDLANTGEMAEGLTMALNLQTPLVNDYMGRVHKWFLLKK